MRNDRAQRILQENSQYEIREGYSGRGMYGKETIAIVVPSSDDVDFLKKKYRGLKVDNMGMSYIVY